MKHVSEIAAVDTAWFAIRCLSGREQVAEQALAALGLSTRCPTYVTNTKPMKRRKSVTVQRPLLKGYVLAEVTEDRWSEVRACPEVIGWVSRAGAPQPIAAKRMKDFLTFIERADRGDFDNDGIGAGIKTGDPLDVLLGPFGGWQVTYHGTIDRKLEGEITVMGAPRRITIPAHQVNTKG